MFYGSTVPASLPTCYKRNPATDGQDAEETVMFLNQDPEISEVTYLVSSIAAD